MMERKKILLRGIFGCSYLVYYIARALNSCRQIIYINFLFYYIVFLFFFFFWGGVFIFFSDNNIILFFNRHWKTKLKNGEK